MLLEILLKREIIIQNETLLKSKSMKALKPFVEYVLDAYYSGVDRYGNQIEVSKESFENRWHKARAILLTSK